MLVYTSKSSIYRLTMFLHSSQLVLLIVPDKSMQYLLVSLVCAQGGREAQAGAGNPAWGGNNFGGKLTGASSWSHQSHLLAAAHDNSTHGGSLAAAASSLRNGYGITGPLTASARAGTAYWDTPHQAGLHAGGELAGPGSLPAGDPSVHSVHGGTVGGDRSVHRGFFGEGDPGVHGDGDCIGGGLLASFDQGFMNDSGYGMGEGSLHGGSIFGASALGMEQRGDGGGLHGRMSMQQQQAGMGGRGQQPLITDEELEALYGMEQPDKVCVGVCAECCSN